MKIGLITPAAPGTQHGNRITAERWARLLRQLGHRVTIAQAYAGEPCDLLIALHARRSHTSIAHFQREHPNHPLIVALTGTDLYHDLERSRRAQTSLDMATRLIVLQPAGLQKLPSHLRQKTRVIYQSVPAQTSSNPPSAIRHPHFDVCVLGHLRRVKDPFRAAAASRLLPDESRIRILHVGGAMNEAMARRALKEMKINPRYRWLGERPRWQARHILARCQLCVLSSRMEGGANVLSEAVVAGVPAIASRIAGNLGILGARYPGYFEVGDTRGLARLLRRAETDASFLKRLKAHGAHLAPLFDPAREQQAWTELLDEFQRR
jgi:putative glycosyltransferase (TIGR04348 family)